MQYKVHCRAGQLEIKCKLNFTEMVLEIHKIRPWIKSIQCDTLCEKNTILTPTNGYALILSDLCKKASSSFLLHNVILHNQLI